MFEYAISAGEGTLIDYGVGEATLCFFDQAVNVELDIDGTLKAMIPANDKFHQYIVRPASPDCTTGQ